MIAIIDYNAGNLFSLVKAIKNLGFDVIVTRDINSLKNASKIVLPGVGAFGACSQNLKDYGLMAEIKKKGLSGIPILGICVGMQLLFETSQESPDIPGLSIIKGTVEKLPIATTKIPHMGWNTLSLLTSSRLFGGIMQGEYVYFAHSYHAVPVNRNIVTAEFEYGCQCVAAIESENIFCVQFHPEKSGAVGMNILRNFLTL